MGLKDDMDADLGSVYFSDFGSDGACKVNGVLVVGGYIDHTAHKYYDIDLGQKIFTFPSSGAPAFKRDDEIRYSNALYIVVRWWREGDLLRVVVCNG